MTVLTLQDMATQSGVAFGTSGARGKVADMTPDLCHAYTTAFINAVVPKTTSIVLGHDLRPSSPEIAAACMAAVQSLGIEVIYGGALPTPALALFAAQNGSPAIVVTGSHIPFDRNGIKFYKEEGEISKKDERAMLDFLVGLPKNLKLPTLPLPDPRVRKAYLNRYIDFLGKMHFGGEQSLFMNIAVWQGMSYPAFWKPWGQKSFH